MGLISEVDGGYMRCGAQIIRVHPQDGMLLVAIGDWLTSLAPAVSASGARFVATDGRDTSFWSKGERALLTVGGEEFPECQSIPATGTPSYVARGVAPDWTLSIGPAYVTFHPAPGSIVNLPVPVAELVEGRQVFVATRKDERLTITVLPGPCRDSVSNARYPDKVEVRSGNDIWLGCGGSSFNLLGGSEWIVEDIAQRGLVENSRVTLNFGADGHLSGHASCNSYGMSYTVSGDRLDTGGAITTRMACAAALDQQEDIFLGLLLNSDRFAFADDGALILYAKDGRTITARR